MLWAAALLATPTIGHAQNNTFDGAVVNSTANTNPGLNEVVTSLDDGVDTTGMSTDDTVANDMALANTVQPERDDKDFPLGLLGLLGLAGLLGRKNNKNDIHVDARNRRDA